MSQHPFLRRFLADPQRVRASIRRIEHGWEATVTSRVTPTVCFKAQDPHPDVAMHAALLKADAFGIAGVDLGMDWAYPHPHLTPPEERADRGLH